MKLREALKSADEKHVAVGHFKISDLVGFNAVIAAARRLNVPILVGVSEGEREFIGVEQVAALVKSVRDEYGHPVFLNADHTHSLEKAKAAAKAGFDEIIFDLSDQPFDENIRQTRQAVEVLKSMRSLIGEWFWLHSDLGTLVPKAENLLRTHWRCCPCGNREASLSVP